MIKILDPKKVGEFPQRSYDLNFLHQNDTMWERYNVPAIASGFHLLLTALTAINKDNLLGVNYAKAFFPTIVPAGSEVDFEAKLARGGITKGPIRLSALANGFDALGDKRTPSTAEKKGVAERLTFYEGDHPLNIRVNQPDVDAIQEITGLPEEATPILYALALSSSSIISRIKNPTTPAWRELNRGLEADEGKRTLPTYDSLEFYLPGGMRTFEPRSELLLRSSIRRKGKVYIVDTTCYDYDGMLYGIRANLRQRKQEVIVKVIGRLLDQIETSGDPGNLAQAIEKRRELKNQINSKP